MAKTILITGGAGYIGSHAVVAFQEAGFSIVVVDDLSNSSEVVFDRIESICGTRPIFVRGDIRDEALLESLFDEHTIDAVIHFAGYKAVGESWEQPLLYYSNNVAGSTVLFDVMRRHGCKRVVFSSSATVYGAPETCPCDEESPLKPANPYGRTKVIVENMLRDLSASDDEWQIALLRYFNPVGAHPTGLIGEDPTGIPNNLMPFVAKVAVGNLPRVKVFGGDYPTPDGTGIRDYIHVMDLVEGHLVAYRHLTPGSGCRVLNLGTGKGHSVLEVVNRFAAISGKEVPFDVVERRAGDVAECFADPTRTRQTLGWEATRDLDAMIRDHWNWQSKNPNGYS